MRLRLAATADIPVLEHWDRQPNVIAAGGDDDVMDWRRQVPRRVPWQWLFIAEHGALPIGMVQIIDPAEEETHYWGEVVPPNLRAIDIWIGEAAHLGKGFGTQMMTLAINWCFAAPQVSAIVVDPLARNTGAIRFYKRLGFQYIEDRIFGEDRCHVLQLARGDID